MVSLKQLKYFDAVARSRHFGKAAESCAVTQPALSMQIQELEKFRVSVMATAGCNAAASLKLNLLKRAGV